MPQSEGSMADSNSVVSVDGRRQRGERTRQAIIEAALSLQEEGVLVPTTLAKPEARWRFGLRANGLGNGQGSEHQ